MATIEAPAAARPYLDQDFTSPDWLRYARTIFFDGYSPPVYPRLDDFDAERLADAVIEMGGDTLRFQPMGYWALWPSKGFPPAPYLGDRDLIAEVSVACRKRNLHLYCYTGYGAPIFELGWADDHPLYRTWVRRDSHGNAAGEYYHYGMKDRRKLCRLNDGYRQALRTVVREYCSYDIDGVYFDAPSCHFYTGVCFCDSCRRGFKVYTGMDLERLNEDAQPVMTNAPGASLAQRSHHEPDLEAQIAWYQWANHITEEDLLDVRDIIHGSGKVMLCHNAHTWTGIALPLQYRIPDGFMIEHSVQTYQRLVHGLMGASEARPYKKLAQMYLGSYCVSNFDEPVHGKPWVVHNTNLEDGDEIRMEGLTTLACGNAPLYATANRLLLDMGHGSKEPAQEVYRLMAEHEPLFKDSRPVAHAGIIMSWEAMRLWQTGRSGYNWEMSEGLALALLDERIAFDVQPSTEVDERWLAEQRVVALCGASGMSDTQAALLRDWVAGGGSLLATWDTGLYDENGCLRSDGGALREVLGVEMLSEPGRNVPDCYLRLAMDHPLLAPHCAGETLMGDGRVIPVAALPGSAVLAKTWDLGNNVMRGPAIVANTYGKGRTVYIAGSLEAHYTVSRVPTLRHLLAGAIRHLSGNAPQPFRLSAPQGVYAVLRRSVNGDLVLWVLAPVGAKDACVGRMRQEYLPVANVGVSVYAPGADLRSVRLLRAGQSIPARRNGDYIEALLPSVHIAEIVHLEL